MLFGTIGQHRIFLWMLAAGAMIGGWYAVTSALRRLLSAGPVLSLVMDSAFGVGAGAIFCGALYTANYGSLRFYCCVAAGLGFALFMLGACPPCRRIISVTKKWIFQSIVTIGRYRWIKVIFR